MSATSLPTLFDRVVTAVHCAGVGGMGLGPLAMQTIVNFVGKGSENLMRRVLAVDYDARERVMRRCGHPLTHRVAPRTTSQTRPQPSGGQSCRSHFA